MVTVAFRAIVPRPATNLAAGLTRRAVAFQTLGLAGDEDVLAHLRFVPRRVASPAIDAVVGGMVEARVREPDLRHPRRGDAEIHGRAGLQRLVQPQLLELEVMAFT